MWLGRRIKVGVDRRGFSLLATNNQKLFGRLGRDRKYCRGSPAPSKYPETTNRHIFMTKSDVKREKVDIVVFTMPQQLAIKKS